MNTPILKPPAVQQSKREHEARPNQHMVVLQNVVRHYGRFAALRGVSAEFEPGKLYLILGENGAGKSTLLRIVAGLLRPTRGSVTLFPVPTDAAAAAGSRDPRALAARIGYMGHAPLLYDELSAMENLRYFASLYGISDQARCAGAIRRVGLDPESKRQVGQYSQGMRQRISLARAIVHDPELLLLDEPFSNVDAHSTQEMARLLGHMRDEGRTILVVTHQPILLERLVDECLLLAGGLLAAREAGVPEYLKSPYGLAVMAGSENLETRNSLSSHGKNGTSFVGQAEGSQP
ncbi:MAG: ABC transporter ATP-binding protein [Candidatus Korobacteraceae bacterium]